MLQIGKARCFHIDDCDMSGMFRNTASQLRQRVRLEDEMKRTVQRGKK
jgi:hypothetical protein